MHRYIGFVAAAFAILGFLAFALMFYAWANQGGMAVAGFQLWGVIASVAAIILGIISRFMAKMAPARTSRTSDFGLGLGLGNILAFAIALFFFG